VAIRYEIPRDGRIQEVIALLRMRRRVERVTDYYFVIILGG